MNLVLVAAAAAQTLTTATGDLPEAPELDAQLFRPSVDAPTTLATETSATPSELSGAGRALFHYAHEPFVYRDARGRQIALVGGVSQLDLSALVGGPRWRLAVAVPVVVSATSDVVPDGGGLGDLRVEGKVGVRDEVAGVGVAGRVGFPTSTVAASLGSSGPTWEVTGVADASQGPWLVAANVGMRGVPRAVLDSGADGEVVVDDTLVVRVAGSCATPRGDGVALELSALSALAATPGDRGSTPVEWLLSGFFAADSPPSGQDLQVRLGAGTALTPGIGAPALRVVAGFALLPPTAAPNLDGDALVDRDDLCVALPEDVDGVADDDGCPEAPPSRTVTVVDAAGHLLPHATATLARAGSTPEPLGLQLPRDLEPGSWVVEAQAPGHESGRASFVIAPDEVGNQPLAVVLAPTKTTPVHVEVRDPEGRPVVATVRIGERAFGPAAALDLVLDPAQAVPVVVEADGFATAETTTDLVAGRVVDLALALVPARAALRADRIVLFDEIAFDPGKSTVLGRSWPALDAVAEILRTNPDLVIRVEAHTESAGAGPANLLLSDRRAAAVRAYLLARDVPAERVLAIGYGESRPLDPADTPEAAARNRRIELVRVAAEPPR